MLQRQVRKRMLKVDAEASFFYRTGPFQAGNRKKNRLLFATIEILDQGLS
jgi:hypothetical protein